MDLDSLKSNYLNLCVDALPRLLSLLDREPSSLTYGSFHRSYWLHRSSDFSSSAAQQGVLSLALWHELDTDLVDKNSLREWLEASIEFTLALQHKDGSYDEWYPNERGWAGPTGYVTYALARACALVKPKAALLEAVRESCSRACRFLADYEEVDVLANHQAMALAAIVETQALFPELDLQNAYSTILARLEASLHEGEWTLEYDGPDWGYQSATISFLARVHRRRADPRIEALVEKLLLGLAFAAFPDGAIAGVTGSRGTKNIFFYGLCYWCLRFPLAARLLNHFSLGMQRGQIPKPTDQEDHYLLYRLPEYLECLLEEGVPLEETALPFESEGDFEKFLPDAGAYFFKHGHFYGAFQLKKGGAGCIYDFRRREMVFEDRGLTLRLSDGTVLSSAFVYPRVKWEMQPYGFSVHTPLTKIRNPSFRPFTFMLFRAAMVLFGRNPGLARWLKSQIRRRVMVNFRSEADWSCRRSLDFSGDELRVRDELLVTRGSQGGSRRVEKLWLGGVDPHRLVPQSRYWSKAAKGLTTIPSEALESLSKDGHWIHTRSFS